jgi:hypothetical protein
MRPARFALLVAVFLLPILPSHAAADGAWLDGATPMPFPPAAGVPTAPPVPTGATIDPRCLELTRPPETPEDRQTVDAGWLLVGEYSAGWGIKLLTGATHFDGMCRPLGYQMFVFADKTFVGPVSPTSMDARTDGAAVQSVLQGPDQLSVVFPRYADTDPLCCPSRTSTASYRIDRSGAQPVLILTSVYTSPTGG